MKNVTVTILVFVFVAVNLSFNGNPKNIRINSMKNEIAYADPVVGCFKSDNIWYSIYGKYPVDMIITRISWGGGYVTLNPTALGVFYINANNVLCVNATFNGPNGMVTYNGILNVLAQCP